MPCLLGCLALVAPRLVIILLVIFGDYIGRAYESTIWPLLGFVFMPMTTLAYALAINENGALKGAFLAIFVVAILLDMGTAGGASHAQEK